MKFEDIKDMSLVELKRLMKEKRKRFSEKTKKIILKRINQLRMQNERFIESLEKSPSISRACIYLEKKGKYKEVYDGGFLIGHEYDLLEAIAMAIDLAIEEEGGHFGNENAEKKELSDIGASE